MTRRTLAVWRHETRQFTLAHGHGWNAHKYAAGLVAAALAEGLTEECEFRKAVEKALRPRGGYESTF